ncbi:MAG: PaaI family thioesterase [Bryobacteraceae bacterium]
MQLLERVQQAIVNRSNPTPLGHMMGFRPVEAKPGRVVIEIDVTPAHHNPMGNLHGGVLCTIADSAMGLGHGCMLAEDEMSVTVEMKINFLRPFQCGKLLAIGSVVRHGRTLTMMECDILDTEDRLIAKATGTFMTLPRP